MEDWLALTCRSTTRAGRATPCGDRSRISVFSLVVGLFCVLALSSRGFSQSTTYDAATSFEQGWTSQSNPNGVWSYGYSSGFTAQPTLYTQTSQNGVNGPNAQYWLSPSVNYGTSPAAEFNNGPAYDDGNVNFLPNQLVLVAGIQGQYSDLIFTAPTAGVYSIACSFRGDQYGIGTVVAVSANGNILFTSTVTVEGQVVPFNGVISLSAGQTIVFSVGPGEESRTLASQRRSPDRQQRLQQPR